MIMRKYFISVIIIVALSFMACGDYLDQVPEKDVETFESISNVERVLIFG